MPDQQLVTSYLKYETPLDQSFDDSPATTISDVPGSGLFRVVDVDARSRLAVEGLLPVGWVELLRLSTAEVSDHEEAIRYWIGIQTPVTDGSGRKAADG